MYELLFPCPSLERQGPSGLGPLQLVSILLTLQSFLFP